MEEERNYANQEKSFISEQNKVKIKDRIVREIFGSIWKLFKTEEENEQRKDSEKKKKQNERLINDKIIRDIGTLFEQQKEDYYKPKRVSSIWNNNYIECESNGDKSSNLSLDEYLNIIEPYLRDIIIDLQSPDTQKIDLTIEINFISQEDTEGERVMHSTSENIKFTPCNDANEIVNEPFESLRSKYQDSLETSMRRSDFIFDSVQLMYYKCHKGNFKRGGLYIDSPDWIKTKKQ